jgi:dipeptidyl-peptidase-4
MKRTAAALLALVVIAGFAAASATTGPAAPTRSSETTGSQLRGKPLYDEWAKLELVKTTGTQRIAWLPDGMGWLEAETDKASGTSVLFKVDPMTQKRERLFDSETERALIAEYNKLNFKNLAGLPFAALSYLPANRGIRFTAADGEFVYFFKERLLRKLERPAGTAPAETAPRAGAAGALPSVQGFSPDFKKFVTNKNYNLWMYDLATKKEEPLTFGGQEDQMNGKTDWVYPEELGQREAFWWSPDGRKIAFLQFDEREVYNFPIIHELAPDRRPAFETVLELERYPKPGRPNPTVRLFVIDLPTRKTVEMKTESSGDVYLIRIAWRNDGSEIFFQRLNRLQNRLELLAADPVEGGVRTILVEEEPCFINLHNDFRQLSDNKRFTWSSERTGWKHLYLYDYAGKLLATLTRGEWEASGIALIDEKAKWVYFTIADNVGMETHFGRVQLDGTGYARLTSEPGTHQASIDPAGRFFLDSWSSLTVPPAVNLRRADGTQVRAMASSNVDKVREIGLREPEFVKLKAADGKTDVHGVLFKPADFDPAKKYPLYVQVYGGPSHRNSNSYQTAGPKAQLAQLGYLVWELDGRGTTRRGKPHLTATYLKFGQVDVDDQAAAVTQLRERPYVDGARVGITGGSYGGYMTCLSILRYPDVYAAGVAASSVTDWRSYDSIYTERYMRTPEANRDGYDKGSALTYAKNLKGKLLLVHGTIDNNVHPGNTIHLIDALQREGKSFDMMYYPEHRHGITGTSSVHLGKLRLEFFLRNLRPDGWEASLKTVW